MILSSSQATLLVNALKRKQGTDLLSAPRVTVMDGQNAVITIAQEFIYPVDYEAATIVESPEEEEMIIREEVHQSLLLLW